MYFLWAADCTVNCPDIGCPDGQKIVQGEVPQGECCAPLSCEIGNKILILYCLNRCSPSKVGCFSTQHQISTFTSQYFYDLKYDVWAF